MQIIVKFICQVSPLLTWQIYQIIVDCLFPIIPACVFNQSHGLWLLSDALHFIISMNLRLKEENQIAPSFETLMDDIQLSSMSWFWWLLTLEGRFVMCWIFPFCS
jgi:hypothetical protein